MREDRAGAARGRLLQERFQRVRARGQRPHRLALAACLVPRRTAASHVLQVLRELEGVRMAIGGVLGQRAGHERVEAGRCRPGITRDGGSGSRNVMRARVAVMVPPSKATRPVSMKYSTAPSENRSLRPSSGWVAKLLGETYDGVPMNWPVDVSSSDGSLAIPKSMIFGCPSSSTMMFEGLMSRWTIPRACAVWSARARRAAISSARRQSSGPSPRTTSSRAPAQALEGDEGPAGIGVAPEVVHDHDRGMGQARGRPRLGQEALVEAVLLLGRRAEGELDALERDRARELGIVRLVDDAHHPAADHASDLVAADGAGKGFGQGLRSAPLSYETTSGAGASGARAAGSRAPDGPADGATAWALPPWGGRSRAP